MSAARFARLLVVPDGPGRSDNRLTCGGSGGGALDGGPPTPTVALRTPSRSAAAKRRSARSDRWARSLTGPSPACRSPVRLAARGPLACSPLPPRVPAPPRFPVHLTALELRRRRARWRSLLRPVRIRPPARAAAAAAAATAAAFPRAATLPCAPDRAQARRRDGAHRALADRAAAAQAVAAPPRPSPSARACHCRRRRRSTRSPCVVRVYCLSVWQMSPACVCCVGVDLSLEPL